MELGAAGVIGALWQVDDMATALLMAKFYDLHMGQGLSPPAALKAAQAWLRTATRADLMAYSEAAAQSGHFAPVKSAELQSMLQAHSRPADSRFDLAWNILQERGLSRSGSGAADLTSPPYAHPYYWGAFVYTGL